MAEKRSTCWNRKLLPVSGIIFNWNRCILLHNWNNISFCCLFSAPSGYTKQENTRGKRKFQQQSGVILGILSALMYIMK